MSYFDVQPTLEPYQCNVEIDADWLHNDWSMPYAEVDIQSGPSRFWQVWGTDIKSAGFGFVVGCLVLFGGSLAIAERSGELSEMRGHSLSVANRSLFALCLAAGGGTFFVSRKFKR